MVFARVNHKIRAILEQGLPEDKPTRQSLLGALGISALIILSVLSLNLVHLILGRAPYPGPEIPWFISIFFILLALAYGLTFWCCLAQERSRWMKWAVLALLVIPFVSDIERTLDNSIPIVAMVERLVVEVTLVTMIFDQKRSRVVTRIAGLSGLFLLAFNCFVLLGHIMAIPFLYSSRVTLPSALIYTSMGFGFLLGTLPYPGLIAPLVSPRKTFRFFSSLGLLAGFILVVGGSLLVGHFRHDIAVFVSDSNVLYEWYWQLAVPSIVLAVLISGLTLELVSVYETREQALEALETSNQALESRVTERTMALQENQDNLENANRELHDLTLQLAEQAQIQEYALEGISQLDADGYYIAVNMAYASIVGYEQDELLGRHWTKTIAPEEIARVEALYKRMLAVGKVQAEVRGLKKGGTPFFKEIVMIPNHDEEGCFHGHFCFMKDITERKQLEADLKNTLMRIQEMERLFSLTSDMVCIVDFRGRFFLVNPSFERVLGYAREEIEGQRFMDFLHPDDVQQTREEFNRILYDSTSEEFENRYRCKDGGYRWLTWTSSTDITAGKIYAVARDSTERKKTEQELKGSLAQLQESEKQRSTYISALTHDLRTPLIAQRHGLSMIQEVMSNEDEEIRELATGLLKNNDNLLELVNRLLESYQYEDGKIPFTFEPVSLTNLFVEIKDEMQQFTATRNMELELATVETISCLLADKYHLKRVFQNLIGNAMEHLPQGQGKIKIQASEFPDKVVIAVSDNGDGIDEEILPALFERYLMGMSIKRKIGSGLGLYICRLIIERHGGHISASNAKEGGAVFTLVLPRSPFEESINVEPVIESFERYHR